MLRSNDLIWSFVVNNYLMGKEPFPFDLLYWNSDSTRMPYKMHSYYLRNMYMNNLLREPGGITLLDTPIDLSKVKTPSYFISTIEDHIAPWRSVLSRLHRPRRPGALRARRLGPHRRHRQSALGQQVRLLDQ
jgi:polyhydroxyalkanoate synthase